MASTCFGCCVRPIKMSSEPDVPPRFFGGETGGERHELFLVFVFLYFKVRRTHQGLDFLSSEAEVIRNENQTFSVRRIGSVSSSSKYAISLVKSEWDKAGLYFAG